MREPEMKTILAQEFWAAYKTELEPEIPGLEMGAMGVAIKAMLLPILEEQLPDMFEYLDGNESLQAAIINRVRAVLDRVDRSEDSFSVTLVAGSTDNPPPPTIEPGNPPDLTREPSPEEANAEASEGEG